MNVKEEYYSDGMTQIHFCGGLVRCDFATLQPDTTGREAAPVPEKKERIIMNLPCFLRMFDTMQNLIDRLVEAGVLQKKISEKLDD